MPALHEEHERTMFVLGPTSVIPRCEPQGAGVVGGDTPWVTGPLVANWAGNQIPWERAGGRVVGTPVRSWQLCRQAAGFGDNDSGQGLAWNGDRLGFGSYIS